MVEETATLTNIAGAVKKADDRRGRGAGEIRIDGPAAAVFLLGSMHRGKPTAPVSARRTGSGGAALGSPCGRQRPPSIMA
jgi:hypothetical protein